MANKRDLKKYITYIADELAIEVMILQNYVKDVTDDKVETLLSRVVDAKDNYLARVSACGGKETSVVKSYYKTLQSDFDKEINEILEQISVLHKLVKE